MGLDSVTDRAITVPGQQTTDGEPYRLHIRDLDPDEAAQLLAELPPRRTWTLPSGEHIIEPTALEHHHMLWAYRAIPREVFTYTREQWPHAPNYLRERWHSFVFIHGNAYRWELHRHDLTDDQRTHPDE
jgi:hypothetical protein